MTRPTTELSSRTAWATLAGAAIALAGVFTLDPIAVTADGLGTTEGLLTVLAAAMLVGGLMMFSPAGRRRFDGWPLPADGPARPATVLGLAVAIGLAAGLLEVALRIGQNASGQRFESLNPHHLWMAPLAYAVILLAVALPVAGLAAIGRPRIGSLRVAAFGSIAIAATGLLYLFNPELHQFAILFLAVGIAALAWIDRRGDRPFFAFLNVFDALEPYTPPPEFERRFAVEEIPPYPFHMQDRSEEDVRRSLNRYEASIAYMDEALGQLVDGLRDRALLDETIVIVTSDHGEMFGEHGLASHGDLLHRPVIEVPLIIRYPARVPGGPRWPGVVSVRDIAATVLDLADPGSVHALGGNSLARVWSDAPPDPDEGVAHAEVNPHPWFPSPDPRIGDSRTVIAGTWQYIAGPGDREELYDIDVDPWEQTDQVETPATRPRLERMRTQLEAFEAVGRDSP